MKGEEPSRATTRCNRFGFRLLVRFRLWVGIREKNFMNHKKSAGQKRSVGATGPRFVCRTNAGAPGRTFSILIIESLIFAFCQ